MSMSNFKKSVPQRQITAGSSFLDFLFPHKFFSLIKFIVKWFFRGKYLVNVFLSFFFSFHPAKDLL